MLDFASGAVYAWLLGDKEPCNRCIASEKFHGTCNFDIIMLNGKILPKSEQNLKFLKQITDHFFDKKWLDKFSNFKPNSDQILFYKFKLQISEFFAKFSLNTHTNTMNLQPKELIRFTLSGDLLPS